jgi:CheY-like chemotaxis protein
MKVFSLDTVIIIDDDETSVFLTSIFIENLEMDIKIQVANNGNEGLELLENELFESNFAPNTFLILLDIKMPKMNGWQFLRAFEDRFPEDLRKNVVIVMLTISEAEQDILKAVKSPLIQEFIHKPISDESFLEILEKYF